MFFFFSKTEHIIPRGFCFGRRTHYYNVLTYTVRSTPVLLVVLCVLSERPHVTTAGRGGRAT